MEVTVKLTWPQAEKVFLAMLEDELRCGLLDPQDPRRAALKDTYKYFATEAQYLALMTILAGVEY